MNIEQFHEYGTHFCNLSNEQFKQMFDFEAIASLHDSPITQEALLLLSQFVVGNISETFNEINRMSSEDRKKVFQCWIEVVKDPDELKSIARYIIEMCM